MRLDKYRTAANQCYLKLNREFAQHRARETEQEKAHSHGKQRERDRAHYGFYTDSQIKSVN